MATTVFEGIIYNNVLDKIILAFSKIPDYLTTPALDILLFGVVLSITYQGFEVIRGAGGANPVLDVIAKHMRPLLIAIFALGVNQYKDFVTPIFKTDIPTIFINAANQAGGLPLLANDTDVNRVPFQTLDTNINLQMAQLKRVFDKAKDRILVPSLTFDGVLFTIFGIDVPGPKLGFTYDGLPALLVSGIVFIVIIVGAITVCLQAAFIVVAWSFVLAFGPMFIALYAFEKTEKYALHWVESVLKYMFALIVVIVLYNILAGQLTGEMTGFADQYVNNPTDVGAFMLKGMSPIVVSIIGAFLLTKAEHLAQDLVGGGPSGAGGFAASMSGKMSGAAKAVGGKAAGAAGAVAGKVAGTAGAVAGTVAGKAAGAIKGAAGALVNEMRRGGGGRPSPGSSFLNAASNLNTGMRNRGGK